MTTAQQPDDELNGPTDPAQLGNDVGQGPGSAPEDNPGDMSSVLARTDGSRAADDRTAGDESGRTSRIGSEFDEIRRQVAGQPDETYGTVGRSHGQGRAGYNGDEDRGYDQSGHRGGLGTSGGREDLSDRRFDADGNPFAGGYGGGNYRQPDPSQTEHLGMHSQNPTDEATSAPTNTAETSGD
ncbi:MAG TPA: hypothetical protein VF629_09435 [Hymenobacter sp.]|jgi:hypothetical protein|uniref:hypothetical protein n=1 Tax=Hymenobacter sp. TaxID=1898978 RepID=UPI002EDA479B